MAIHPTAIVHPNSQIDKSVNIGPFCVIDENVRIHADAQLYQNVYLTGWTTIGEGCSLHPGVIVGHIPQDIKYGIPQKFNNNGDRGYCSVDRSYCSIGQGTILRENVTIHRGVRAESHTLIGQNCFLLAGSHVAHNCVLGDHVTLINNVLLAGHVHVDDGVTMGGGAVVHQFVRVGKLAMIPGNGRVPMDVVPYALLNEQGQVAGMNRVGMMRAKMRAEEVEEIRQAYRNLFGASHFSRGKDAVLRQVKTEAGKVLSKYLLNKSIRGIAGKSRKLYPKK